MKLLISLLFVSLNVLANETPLTYYKAKSTLPSDFGVALDHVQLYSKKPIEVTQQIIFLDQLLEQISEEERLFFTKAELYKSLFRFARLEPTRAELYELTTLELATRIYQQVLPYEQTHPYLPLLFGGVLSDLNRIMKAPGYRTFVQKNRTTPNQLDANQRTIKNKLELILPWLAWFQKGEVELVNKKLQPALEHMLESVISRLQDFHYLTRNKELNLETERAGRLVFFDVRPRPNLIIEKTPKQEPSLEQTLEPLLNQVPEEPPKTDESWRPREEETNEFFNPEPDPDYQAPQELPAPVNDWLQAL